jgi:hypothetical protein
MITKNLHRCSFRCDTIANKDQLLTKPLSVGSNPTTHSSVDHSQSSLTHGSLPPPSPPSPPPHSTSSLTFTSILIVEHSIQSISILNWQSPTASEDCGLPGTATIYFVSFQPDLQVQPIATRNIRSGL